MKPNYKTTLLHNRHVVGYHTNEHVVPLALLLPIITFTLIMN